MNETNPTLSWLLAEIKAIVAAVGPSAVPQIEQWVASLGLPAWKVSLIDGVLESLVGQAASFRFSSHDVTAPDFSALLAAIQADVPPVQGALAQVAALPGLQTKLAADVAALTAALSPLLPTS